MPKRPTLAAPAFGAWLATLRAHQSYEAIAQRLRPHVRAVGLRVDRSSVKKYEAGRPPNWPMLYAFSQVYRTSLPEMVERLITSLVIWRGSETPAIPLVSPTNTKRRRPTGAGSAESGGEGLSDAITPVATSTTIDPDGSIKTYVSGILPGLIDTANRADRQRKAESRARKKPKRRQPARATTRRRG